MAKSIDRTTCDIGYYPIFRPERNLSGDETYGLETKYTVPAE